MKVKELITKLLDMPMEAEVNVWVEGTGLDKTVSIEEVSQEGLDRVDLDVLAEPDVDFIQELVGGIRPC